MIIIIIIILIIIIIIIIINQPFTVATAPHSVLLYF